MTTFSVFTCIIVALASSLVTNSFTHSTSGENNEEPSLQAEDLCYGTDVNRPQNMFRIATDESGNNCDSGVAGIVGLVQSGEFADAYRTACPKWNNTKSCFSNHLQNKCNEVQKAKVRNSVENFMVSEMEGLCQPLNSANSNEVLSLLNRIRSGSLVICVLQRRSIWAELSQCDKELLDQETDQFLPFSVGVTKFVGCAREAVKSCPDSSEHNVIDSIGMLILQNYDSLWEQWS